MPDFRCPSCDCVIEFDDDVAGQKEDCPACGNVVRWGERIRRARVRHKVTLFDSVFDALMLCSLVLLTLVIPLVGLIVGAIALASRSGAKRSQGFALIVVGVVAMLIHAAAWMR